LNGTLFFPENPQVTLVSLSPKFSVCKKASASDLQGLKKRSFEITFSFSIIFKISCSPSPTSLFPC